MTIDWTHPVETTEDPPRPVRVLATDRPNPDRPVVVMRDDGQIFTVTPDGIGNPQGHANGTYGRITLRNVAPPKPEPEPVRHVKWCLLGVNGTLLDYEDEEEARSHHDGATAECRRIAWMSDGSPVPGEGHTNCWANYNLMTADRDEWRTKAEILQVEVERLGKALLSAIDRRADAELEARSLRTIRDDLDDALGVAWRLMARVEKAEAEIVRLNEEATATPKKTAAEAVANVAAMMGPVKNCTTCRFDISICGYSTHIPGCGWEAKSHD